MEMEGEVVAPKRRWGRAVFGVALVAFVGLWAFAFWYEANRPSPEPLDPTSFSAANAACRSAVGSLAALAPVGTAPTVIDRTNRVQHENAVLTNLVVDFRAIHPRDHDGAKALAAFATDWQHLTASRERYVQELLATGKRPKLVIAIDPTGAPVTIRMREYAQIHKLTDCTPDSLQGEVVEGPRVYPRVG